MIDRRGFIKASLLAGSLPALGLLPNALANGIDVRTIIDGACTDVRAFALASGAIACGADPRSCSANSHAKTRNAGSV